MEPARVPGDVLVRDRCTQCTSPLPADAADREQRYWRERGYPYPPEACCSAVCMDAWWSQHGHTVRAVGETTLEQLAAELREVGLDLPGVGEVLPS